VLGYEILKWESDLPNPALYHPVSDDIAELKVELLPPALPEFRSPTTGSTASRFLGLDAYSGRAMPETATRRHSSSRRRRSPSAPTLSQED